jgi:hypothetical protein
MDIKKRRSCVALLFAASDAGRQSTGKATTRTEQASTI